MTIRLAALLVLCLALIGCFSSVRVSRSNSLGDPPKGIPFYAKTGVCRQQTDWLEPQYILTYESKSGTTATKVLSRQQFSQKTVQDFIADPGAPSAWKTAIFDLPGPDSINESISAEIAKEETSGNWVRVSNTSAVEAVVDYSNVFYLNSARPLAGTTQVDAKLAADGTLTEGSVQVQDQTLEAISSLISSASTAATGLGAHFVPSEPAPAQSENKLSVKAKFYRHSHSQYLDLKTPATPFTCVASPSGVVGGSFIVTEVADSSKAKADGDKDNTISVSGSIVLPKAAPSSSPPPPSGTTPTPKKP